MPRVRSYSVWDCRADQRRGARVRALIVVLLAFSVLHVTEYVPHWQPGSAPAHHGIGVGDELPGGGEEDAGSPEDSPPGDHEECVGIRWAADSGGSGMDDGWWPEIQPVALISRDWPPEPWVQSRRARNHARTGRAILSSLCVARI